MIAPIRPPLIAPPRRPQRETPLERARCAVAAALLPHSAGQGRDWRRRGLVRWVFSMIGWGIFAAAAVIVLSQL